MDHYLDYLVILSTESHRADASSSQQAIQIGPNNNFKGYWIAFKMQTIIRLVAPQISSRKSTNCCASYEK